MHLIESPIPLHRRKTIYIRQCTVPDIRNFDEIYHFSDIDIVVVVVVVLAGFGKTALHKSKSQLIICILTQNIKLHYADNTLPVVLSRQFAAILGCVCSVHIGDDQSRFLGLTKQC